MRGPIEFDGCARSRMCIPVAVRSEGSKPSATRCVMNSCGCSSWRSWIAAASMAIESLLWTCAIWASAAASTTSQGCSATKVSVHRRVTELTQVAVPATLPWWSLTAGADRTEASLGPDGFMVRATGKTMAYKLEPLVRSERITDSQIQTQPTAWHAILMPLRSRSTGRSDLQMSVACGQRG